MAPQPDGHVEVATGSIGELHGEFALREAFSGAVLVEVVELPEEFQAAAPLSPKYIACVKRNDEDTACDFGIHFGEDFVIDDLAIVGLYNPDTQKIKGFHCGECAVIVWEWIKSRQHDWHTVFCSGFDESEDEGPVRTLH